MMFKETRRGPNNGFNNTGLRFGDHGTKEILLGVVDPKILTGLNFALQLPTARNNVQQRVQTDGTCNRQQC